MTDTTEKRVFAPSDSAEFMRRRAAAEGKAKRRKEAKKRANKRAKKRKQTANAPSAAARRNYEQLARATGGARRQARLIG